MTLRHQLCYITFTLEVKVVFIDRVWLKPYNISSKLLSFYKVLPAKGGYFEKS